MSHINCPFCGGPHPQTACPRVKSIEYDERGNVRRVELQGPAGEDATATEVREKSVVEQMRERPSAASTLYTKDGRGGL